MPLDDTALAATAEAELLRRYVHLGAEEAFAELVDRYIPLVHSAAFRQTNGNATVAADLTQLVFTELARQSRRLIHHPSLAGWLYTTTYRMAARHARTEARRQRREQEAYTMQWLHRDEESEPGWQQLSPLLDAAMHQLNEADRLAVLLRCFEQQSFAEIGARLGLSENAARMRVERALEKLRVRLARRGVTSTTAALSLALGSNAIATAPAALSATVTSIALTTVATSGTTLGTLSFLTITTMSKLKLTAAALLVAGLGTSLVFEQIANRRLRSESRELSEQLTALSAARETVTPSSEASVEPSPVNSELLRLRGEVARLRRELAQSEQRRAAAARLPASTSPPEAASEDEAAQEATKQFGIRRMNEAKLLVLGLYMGTEDHLSDQRAASLEIAAARAKVLADGDSREAAENLRVEDFELVYQGALREVANPAQAIVLRERESWQTHEGRWARTYGFADGHSEVKMTPDGDFSRWEAERQPQINPPQPDGTEPQ